MNGKRRMSGEIGEADQSTVQRTTWGKSLFNWFNDPVFRFLLGAGLCVATGALVFGGEWAIAGFGVGLLGLSAVLFIYGMILVGSAFK